MFLAEGPLGGQWQEGREGRGHGPVLQALRKAVVLEGSEKACRASKTAHPTPQHQNGGSWAAVPPAYGLSPLLQEAYKPTVPGGKQENPVLG